MDGQEVEVVVMPCEDSADFELLQVASGRSELMLSAIQHFAEDFRVETETNSRHFCHGVASVDHVLSPPIHGFLEFGEVLWNYILKKSFNIIIRRNVPEVSPFGILGWRTGCVGFVFALVAFQDVLVVSAMFDEFGGGSNLVVGFGQDFLHLLSLVEQLAPTLEVLFHKIDEPAVFLLVNPGILDDEAAVFVEGLGDHLALGLSGVGVGQEGLDVDDGDFEGGKTEGQTSPSVNHILRLLTNIY